MSLKTTASYDPGTPGSLAGSPKLLLGSWEEEGVEGSQSWKGICLCSVAFETHSEGQREVL